MQPYPPRADQGLDWVDVTGGRSLIGLALDHGVRDT